MKKIYLYAAVLLIIFLSIFAAYRFLNRDIPERIVWKKGDKITYKFLIKGKTKTSSSFLNVNSNNVAPEKNYDFSTSGNLLASIVSIADTNVWIYCSIDNFESIMNNQKELYDYSLYPALIETSCNGTIQNILFSTLMSPKNQDVFRSIINFCSFSFDSKNKNWTSVEKESLGPASVAYYKNTLNTFTRKIIKFIEISDEKLKNSDLHIKKAESKITINSNLSWFKEIVSSMDIDFYHKRKIIFSSKADAEIKLTDNDFTNPFWKQNIDIEKIKSILNNPFESNSTKNNYE